MVKMGVEREGLATPFPIVQLRWMLVPLFCSLTGYTEKAVRRKIEDGVWVQGRVWQRHQTAGSRSTCRPTTNGLSGGIGASCPRHQIVASSWDRSCRPPHRPRSTSP